MRAAFPVIAADGRTREEVAWYRAQRARREGGAEAEAEAEGDLEAEVDLDEGEGGAEPEVDFDGGGAEDKQARARARRERQKERRRLGSLQKARRDRQTLLSMLQPALHSAR